MPTMIDLRRWAASATVAAAMTMAGAAVAAPTPTPTAPAPREAQLGDLRLVRDVYLAKDKAFPAKAKARATALLDKAEARAGTMSQAEMFVRLAQVGALADNGHSGVRYRRPGALDPRRLPLRFIWLADGLLVARAAAPDADLAGARVLAIEGRSAPEAYRTVRTLYGGPESARLTNVGDMIDRWGVLHALGLAARPDRVRLTLRLRDGAVVTRTVAMAQTSPTGADERLWAPDPIAGETGWTPALTGGDLPLYLRDGEELFRLAPLKDLDAVYIQFRSNESDDRHDIAAFQARAVAAIGRDAPRNLVVDLRFDVGGNLTTTLDFMRALPARVPGKVFVLTGPYTFSAGIVSAAALKIAGGDKVVIVGDEVGDRLRFWSEGGAECLPNSKLCMRYTDGMFDMARGCSGEPGCFGDQFGVTVGSLKPDVRAPLTIDAYLARRDPAIDAIARRLGSPSRSATR
jgi:hypothetical protein